MALPGNALRRLLDGLADLYTPASPQAYPARVIGVVSALIAVESCSYNDIGPADHVLWRIQPTDVGAFPDAAALFARHLPEHPVLAYQQDHRDGRGRRISDFLSDRQFRSLGLYREFYRPAGVNYQLAITVPAPAGGLIGVALNRHARDFTDDHIELLDLLRPHIRQAAATVALLARPPAWAPCRTDGTPLLTPRQLRILQLVAAGQPDRGIARALGISTRTVHTHLQHAYRALDVTSRTEALARLQALPQQHAPCR